MRQPEEESMEYFAMGSYCSKRGRMIRFNLRVTADDMTSANQRVVDTITSRRAYSGKLSFTVIGNLVRHI
jgi:hypothetical protein